MNIFITGINGFIGSNLARYLVAMGHRISGSVRPTSDRSFIADLPLQLFVGDIGEPEFLTRVFMGQDIVFHIAALASDWGTMETFHRINVLGTMNVAKAAQLAKIQRLVYLSSTAVYGFAGYRQRVESDPKPATNFPYATTKLQAETWLRDFGQQNDLPVTIIQAANVYGPHDRTFFLKFAPALEKGLIPLINRGQAWTCPTYVENLVYALWLAANHPRGIGETFIISDDLEINWAQFVAALCQQLSVRAPRLSASFSVAYGLASLIEGIYKLLRLRQEPILSRYRICNFGIDYHFSIQKARNMLGYSPPIGLEEAIRRTVAWYRHYQEGKRHESGSR
ncbi:MAG: NAD-dependent epimerase/dehydratase family protein [candidate division KSB1 bacterium]|nr:NAD-dependent epimerase/dehydratase family protein [candidate division KSB1 bacterium]MDZ7341941.1 NAD-dependent epimerase/dehydratase family protein [candidate division KSB1 bacterium]